jgi:hypothetical protein
MKKRRRKTGAKVLLALGIAGLILAAIAAAWYVLPFYGPDATISVRLENNVNYRAEYVPNDFYKEQTRPAGELYYLMSYTDHLEIENFFTARFGQSVRFAYTYTAVETFLIRYQRSNDANGPVVYEERVVLDEASGQASGTRAYIGGFGDETVFLYTVDPRDYIETYRRFVDDHQSKKDQDMGGGESNIRFTADLLLEFTYTIRLPDLNVSEVVVSGLAIPLTLEAYSPAVTGQRTREAEVAAKKFVLPELLYLEIMAAWVVICVFALYAGIRLLTKKKHEPREEVRQILKKYTEDILVVAQPPEISEYHEIPVRTFQELLNVALNLNKHILCCQDEYGAEFYVIADKQAYSFFIDYEVTPESESETPVFDPVREFNNIVKDALPLFTEINHRVVWPAGAYEELKLYLELYQEHIKDHDEDEDEEINKAVLLTKLRRYETMLNNTRAILKNISVPDDKPTETLIACIESCIPRLNSLTERIKAVERYQEAADEE